MPTQIAYRRLVKKRHTREVELEELARLLRAEFAQAKDPIPEEAEFKLNRGTVTITWDEVEE